MLTAKKAESHVRHGFSQFEITSKLLRNLYNYDLTPVTKLVLLELTTHMNESKNGAVVFPSVGYIAEVLGIGLTATKKAINDLIKQGFIIKTKRNNVKGNYNKYLFTSKITGIKMDEMNIYSHEDKKVRNLTEKPSQNELFKQPQNELFLLRTNNNEKINNKDDEKYLKLYAQKRGVKNVSAYINAIKRNGGDIKIIEEYKQIEKKKKSAALHTKNLIEQYKQYEKDAVPPTESWKALRNTIFKDYK